MKVITSIKVYEIDGQDAPYGSEITIESHWNNSDLVELRIDGTRTTVRADQLERAIANARNHK